MGNSRNNWSAVTRPTALLAVATAAAGCAREPAERVYWPQPTVDKRLPERLVAPFDPESEQPRPFAPAPSIPPWAGDEARPYASLVLRAAVYYQLPSELIWAIIKIESGFRRNAVSPSGARGLMQLMPATARSLGVRNPHDAEQAIMGGARYLRRLANRFQGDLTLVLAGYNAGPTAVARHRGIPPYPETQRYVRKVLGLYWASASAEGQS